MITLEIILTVINTAVILILILMGSGKDGFNIQDRIDLFTIFRRTNEIMAQLDDLITGLNAIGDDVNKLEQELQTAQQAAANNQPTDLTTALNIVNGLRSKLETTTSTASDATSGNATQSSGVDTSSSASSSEVGSSGSDPSVQPPASTTSGDAGTADTQQPQG